MLARGENAMLSCARLTVTVSADVPVDISALLLDRDGKVTADGDFIFYNQPIGSGVAVTAAGIDLDLGLVAVAVDRVLCAASVEDQHPAFGSLGRPRATVTDRSGELLFEFTLHGLAGERAVIVFEFYRRQGTWKLRAVGQGYDGGLGALVTGHGVEVEPDVGVQDQAPSTPGGSAVGPLRPPATIPAPTAIPVPPTAIPVTPTIPVPPGTSDPERQFRVLTAIFEDAARSAAGYRSAVDFAEQRRERDLGSTFDDPRLRENIGPARQLADQRYADLVRRATADHRRDVEALARELADLTPGLPAALAPWGAPVWRSPGRSGHAAGVRAGELHLPEAPDLRLPLLISVPLRRPIWFDESDGFGEFEGPDRDNGGFDPFSTDGASATDGGVVAMARAVILRLLMADSSIRLHLCDTAGALTAALGAVAGSDSAVLGAPVARTASARTDMLRLLAERIDLVEMARQAGALDALPGPDERVLLVVTDVPVAFQELDLRRLRYLVEKCGRAVQLVLLGTPDDAGPTADIARASLRLRPAVGSGISDGWVGLAWTFTPDFGPTDPASIAFG